MMPFHRHDGDVLWKFKIKDWFDSTDPVACVILRLLAADEDLMNIERFKEILETDMPEVQVDEVTTIKRNNSRFFLLKLRLSFLHNVFKEVIGYGKGRKCLRVQQSLDDLVTAMNVEVQTAYDELKATMKKNKTTMKVIANFRNRVSFHYSDGSFRKALDLVDLDIGEMIVNDLEKDLRSIVTYQILGLIPHKPILKKDEVIKIKEEVELLQGMLHIFTIKLFDEYFMSRRLDSKIISSEDPQFNNP